MKKILCLFLFRLASYSSYCIKTQIQRIFEKNKQNFIKHGARNLNYLSDIYDGEIYQNVLNSDIGKEIADNKAFTFLISTDGIKFCNKSKLSVWPFVLAINELPLAIRFCICLLEISILGTRPDTVKS